MSRIEKGTLREEMLAIRQGFSDCEIEQNSKKIKERLFNSTEFKSAKKILFYSSFRNEVQTRDMIKEALVLGKRVILPIMEPTAKELYLSELKNYDLELAKNNYGILESRQEYIRRIDFDQLDLLIIPGLAFDLDGNRLGYGGGYYDRLLIRNLNIYRLAICFEAQISRSVPIDTHDIQVNKIITEKREIIV